MPSDYERHMATVGISLVWPPPPPQDVRLNRRESEFEPVFSLVGGEERRLGADGPGGNERLRSSDRERRRRRRGGGYNLFDTDENGDPIDPSRPQGTGVDANRRDSTSQSQSPENQSPVSQPAPPE
jgi:hypothetical protein